MHSAGNASNVVLIGMPAVGKSTIGVLLAKRLGLGFVDTDIVIQAAEGQTLQALIGSLGMERFCDLEASHLCALDVRSHVIATGGSAIYRSEAMDCLRRHGRIIYLNIDLAPLKTRLEDIDARGVVYAPGQGIDDLYAERAPLYARWADITVDCNRRSPEQIVSEITRGRAAAAVSSR